MERPYPHPYPRPARSRRSRVRLALMALGVAAILTGAGLVVIPLVNVVQRSHADQTALGSWNKGGSSALRGAVPAATAAPHVVVCGSGSPADYALVTFSVPAAEHYGGVATNGTWDSLHDRSMVHYTTTPAPGQQGNSIIAFHREPDYEHIDQLGVGDTVSVQDRSCRTFVYRVTAKSVLDPSMVTQLAPTTGHDLTLITCTPFWIDTQRIVWRATLISPAA